MPKAKDVSVSDRIDGGDFSRVAESIVEEWKSRKKKREDSGLTKQWDEVDRQVRMEPELSHKQDIHGIAIKDREWMPETELPLQAQTLEMQTADIRRLIFPKNRDYFQSRAALTDEYVTRYKRAGSPFSGEVAAKDIIHSELDQDNGDRLAGAMIAHWHSQYDFRAHSDLINAQAVAYGFGAGRWRKVRRRILGYDARPTGPIDQKIPVLVPRDSRKVFLDDNTYSVMHEGHILGPNIIQERTVNYSDYVAAAKAGGRSPKKEEGGYLLRQIRKLSPDDKDDTITLLELEGDLVVEQNGSTVIVRDVVVTAAIGSADSDGDTAQFVRYRLGEQFSTYQIHQYHVESPNAVSGSSPLLKGRPIAQLAAQAMNRLMESAQLKSNPPVGWNKDEASFGLRGGPVIKPYAQWPTTDLNAIKAYIEVGGDTAVLFQIFVGLVNLYTDVVGVTPARLGAETKSHTTAFAKDVELTQGTIRTIDYVNSILEGPMTRGLQIEYRMGLSTMRGRQTIYVPPWNEFVNITRRHLPDIVKFWAVGSGAPAEDQARSQQMLNFAQLAVQLDQLSLQIGNDPTVDLPALIKQALTLGGWTDLDEITTTGTGETPQAGQLPGLVTENLDLQDAI